MLRWQIVGFMFLLSSMADLGANSLPLIVNVRVERGEPERLRIYYDLMDDDQDEVDVMIRLFPDSSFIGQPSKAVYGHIGGGIAPGTGRCIVLEGRLPARRLTPLLLAHDGTGYGGEMMEVDDDDGKFRRFYLDRYEVTNKEFEAFVEVGGYAMKEYWLIDDGSVTEPEIGWNYNNTYRWRCPKHWDLKTAPYWSRDPYSEGPDSPATGISWFEAYAYAKWAGKRLPRIAEWRLAAGEEEGRSFPWGDDLFGGQRPPRYTLCNWRLGFEGFTFNDFADDGYLHAAPAGSYSPQGDSPQGIADMIGNVWEWCDDDVGDIDYGTFVCAHRSLLGGGWKASVPYLSPEERRQDQCPLFRTNSTGFRCARW